jgi:hypothetical protein
LPVATLGGITSSTQGFAAAVGRSRHRQPSHRWRRQLVAWVGAVLNAHRPVDQRWFALILWCGIVGIALTGVRHGKPHYGHGHGGYLVTAPDCISANPQAPTPERKPSFAGQLVACACRRRSCFLPTDRPSPRSWPLVSQLDLALLGAPVRRSRPSGGGRRDRRGRTMRGGSLHVPTRRSACLQAPILIDTLARSTDAVLWSGRTGAAGGSHHLPTLNRERSTEYGGGTNSNASIMRRVCYWLPGARPSDDIYLRRDRTRHQAASARHRSARSGDALQYPCRIRTGGCGQLSHRCSFEGSVSQQGRRLARWSRQRPVALARALLAVARCKRQRAVVLRPAGSKRRLSPGFQAAEAAL